MKKIVFSIVAALSLACFARPHGGPGFGRPGPWRGGPVPHHYHHYHHHHHGAGAFWTGVGIGLVGSALLPPPPPPAYPVVVAAPARVWVPPVYGERPVYRAGIWVGTERYVITPGYWR